MGKWPFLVQRVILISSLKSVHSILIWLYRRSRSGSTHEFEDHIRDEHEDYEIDHAVAA